MGGVVKQANRELPAKLTEQHEPSWKDTHVQKILGTKLVKQKNFKNINKGVYFPDEQFPSDLVKLLCSHPLISHFDAEFALYVAKSTDDQNIDVTKILQFLLCSQKPKQLDEPVNRFYQPLASMPRIEENVK